MRIIFTGSQGTGKTTILNYFNDKTKIITGITRSLSKEGININEKGDEYSQRKIFDKYVELLNDKQDYISDRGLIDVYVYSSYLFNQGRLSLDELSYEMGEIDKLVQQKDILWIYFPIEFDIVDDGVRSIDENYRKYIDDNIHNILDDLDINYKTIHGSVEERIKQLEYWIRDYENNNHIS